MRIGEQVRLKLADGKQLVWERRGNVRVGELVIISLEEGKQLHGVVKEVFPREGLCLVSHETGPWLAVPEQKLSRARRGWVGIVVFLLLALAASVGLYVQMTEITPEPQRRPVRTECA